MFSPQFENDLKAWKMTRPEYKKLLQAIKAGEPDEKLGELANDAGSFIQEVVDLKNLLARASAPNMRSRAAKHKKLQEELAVLTEKVQSIDKAMSTAKIPLQRDELESELYDLVERRQTLQMAVADSAVAAGCVDAARAAGLL